MNGIQPIAVRSTAESSALLFGIGNSGRSDDGLGWAFLDRIQQDTFFDGQLEYRFQLQIEDAALVSSVERVVFVDSYSGDLPGGFRFETCEPSSDYEFTTHVLAPQAVMSLCQKLYGARPQAEILVIGGERWGLNNGLSSVAEHNLKSALQYFRGYWK